MNRTLVRRAGPGDVPPTAGDTRPDSDPDRSFADFLLSTIKQWKSNSEACKRTCIGRVKYFVNLNLCKF